MRELHAVKFAQTGRQISLRGPFLLFDKMRIVGLDFALKDRVAFDMRASEVEDLTFLRDHQLVEDSPFPAEKFKNLKTNPAPLKEIGDFFKPEDSSVTPYDLAAHILADIHVRKLASSLALSKGVDAVPVCTFRFTDRTSGNGVALPSEGRSATTVVHVVLEKFPIPDEEIPWSDVLAFKSEMRDKQWNLRRFLHQVASRHQTAAEIRDDLDWTLNEYGKEMGRLNAKRSIGFIEVYIIPAVEALESFKLSSLLKALVSIKKRRIELLDGEAKAAGRECAYIFDARKRFGNS
jgi:hypothetical protein